MILSSFGRRWIALADAVKAGAAYGFALLSGTNTWTGVQTFSAIPVLSGGAVSFPAVQVASAGANDLDDYEEGAWTPDLKFGGANTGITYSTRAGRYTKIGNIVHAWAVIVLTNKGSATGAATCTGLPYTAINNIPYYAGSVGWYTNTTSVVTAGVLVPASGTIINLYNLPGATLFDTNFQNTTQIFFGVTYEA